MDSSLIFKMISRATTKPKLYVNVFPSPNFNWDCIKIDTDKKVIYVRHLFEFHSSLSVELIPKFWCFKTDGIFFNCCQSEIYTSIINQVFEKIFLGIDIVFLSYGQNDSGKTYTLSGLYNQFNLRGIVPRFVTDLFSQKEALLQRDNISTQVWMSSVDIFGSTIIDLLSKPRKVCKVANKVNKLEIKSELHCLETLFKVESQRQTEFGQIYKSHTASNILTFTVKVTALSSQECNDKVSRIHFVDLAGVETIQRNPLTSFKDQFTQGKANVTKTLMEIFALKSQHKNSKHNFGVNKNIHTITKYLDTSFSPTSCINLLCNIRPHYEDLMITLSVLKFSLALRGISLTKPEVHFDSNQENLIKNLHDQVRALKDELYLKDLWKDRSPMKVSQERVDFVKRSVDVFLKGDLTETELLTVVDDCGLVLNIMKTIDKPNRAEKKISVALQTDGKEFSKEKEVVGSIEDRRRSSLKAKNSFGQSPRNILFDAKQSKPNKKEKALSEKTGTSSKSKNKENKKLKEEKPILVSEEVQVNLIEPNAQIPKIDSREGLWAAFMISRPEIQIFLNKLSADIIEKDKIRSFQTITFENISYSLRKTQLSLNTLAAYRHIDHNEIYDKDGKLVIPEDESKLVRELNFLQQEFETCQQKLIEAQTDWLEASEKLNCEKQKIEKDFKQFCASNNFLELNYETAARKSLTSNLNTSYENLQNDNVAKPSEIIVSSAIDFLKDEELLQQKYTMLQSKYLKIGN